MISVLIVDDQALIRTAVGQLVSHEPGFTVVGDASDGIKALDETRRLHPDVILMDLRMPIMDGIEATRLIRADPDLTGTRIIILTTFEEDENVLGALRAGASGFIGKDTNADALMHALRTVHAGDALLSPRATKALVDRYVQPGTPPATPMPAELHLLTDRELEILRLVATGLSTTEIAEQLVISPQTAKTHINRTMTKLHAHDRAQLVIIAYETGLLVPGHGHGREQDTANLPASGRR
jgi:DNA-binding NarL/FixJ family response regulator